MSGPAIFLIANIILAAVFALTAGTVGIAIAALLIAEGVGYYLYDRYRSKEEKGELREHG